MMLKEMERIKINPIETQERKSMFNSINFSFEEKLEIDLNEFLDVKVEDLLLYYPLTPLPEEKPENENLLNKYQFHSHLLQPFDAHYGIRAYSILFKSISFMEEPVAIDFVTRLRPFSFSFLGISDIEFKFNNKTSLTDILPDVFHKLDTQKDYNKYERFVGGYLNNVYKTSETFIQSIESLERNYMFKEKVKTDDTSFTLLIGYYVDLPKELLSFVDYSPFFEFRDVDLCKKFVFFVYPKGTDKSFVVLNSERNYKPIETGSTEYLGSLYNKQDEYRHCGWEDMSETVIEKPQIDKYFRFYDV